MAKFDEYGVDRSGNWLQMFAVEPNTPDDDYLGDEDEDLPAEDDDLEDEDDNEEGKDDDSAAEDDEDEGDDDSDDDGEPGDRGRKTNTGKPRTFTEAEVNRIVQKRLARAQEKLARNKVDPTEALFEEAQIPALDKQDTTQALRLWTYLKHNPEISREVDKILNSKQGTMPAYIGPAKKAESKSSSVDTDADRFELLETKLDLRSTDPTFKKYERRIMDWAETEGIEIKDAKSLKLAFRAWKGENSRLLLANAEKRGAESAAKNRQAAQKGKGIPRKGSGKRGKVDYTKMSAEDILAEEGISLFDED